MEPPPPPARAASSRFGAALRVARKELVSSLRDRQTVIYTFVLPICMYPVLFWVMLQGFLVVQGQKERTETRVGVAAVAQDAIPAGLTNALAPPSHGDTQTNPVQVEVAAAPHDTGGARAWVASQGDEADAERPHAVLFLPGPDADAQLFFDSTESKSVLARERVAGRLPGFATKLRSEAATAASVDPLELDPIELRSNNVAPKSDSGALILSMLLPMLLVIMSVMGAFFPAVDLTAGEKERGTAETTMLLPVPRAAVHEGKVLAVCATAVVATFLNLIALGFSAENLIGLLARSAQFEVKLPVLALFAVAPLALLFSFFVAAVLTSAAGLANSFKEGQAMLGPVQLVFILPAMIGAVPGIDLDLRWALVPIANVVLAFRAMLLGKELYLEYAVTAVALFVYAILATRFAVLLLSRESVALSSSTIPLKRLFSTLRSSGDTQ
ncbi:MAG: ABC transporter permease [bacterium]|nr:ABC transporter permease [bacterium]